MADPEAAVEFLGLAIDPGRDVEAGKPLAGRAALPPVKLWRVLGLLNSCSDTFLRLCAWFWTESRSECSSPLSSFFVPGIWLFGFPDAEFCDVLRVGIIDDELDVLGDNVGIDEKGG